MLLLLVFVIKRRSLIIPSGISLIINTFDQLSLSTISVEILGLTLEINACYVNKSQSLCCKSAGYFIYIFIYIN